MMSNKSFPQKNKTRFLIIIQDKKFFMSKFFLSVNHLKVPTGYMTGERGLVARMLRKYKLLQMRMVDVLLVR